MNLPAANCESIRLDAETVKANMSILRNFAQGAARFVFGKLLPRWAYPVLRGPLRGTWYFLGATAGEAGGVSVHLGIQEKEQTRCLARILNPGQIFFDVGANVGFYSLLASRLVGPRGRVIAFEPLPHNIAFLHRHIALNHITNVAVLPVACANDETTALFVMGENNALGRLADLSRDQTNASSHPLLVGTLSLDGAVKKLGVKPDAVKIDVEGAELHVLEGAVDLLTQIKPALLLSTHSDELRRSCLQLLRDHNYEIEPLNGDSLESATEFFAATVR